MIPLPRRFSLPVIGIIGGVGSGKSSIAREASQLRPWFVLDADQLGHQILQFPEVITELTNQFGQNILRSSGAIDRSALAERVFGPENIEKRQQLEAIVHPHIRRLAEEGLERAAQSGDYELLILDAAILLEAGWNDLCDAVVFVETPFDVRLKRVAQARGWNEDELKQREASQFSLQRKRDAADEIIVNESTLNPAVESLIAFVEHRYPSLHESPN